jgi:enoyl-CoA hydratase
MGGSQRLADRVASGRARELVMTADLYSAHTMLSSGVVNAVHAHVHSAAAGLTLQLAEGPTKAHAATKAIVSAWCNGGVEQSTNCQDAYVTAGTGGRAVQR